MASGGKDHENTRMFSPIEYVRNVLILLGYFLLGSHNLQSYMKGHPFTVLCSEYADMDDLDETYGVLVRSAPITPFLLHHVPTASPHFLPLPYRPHSTPPSVFTVPPPPASQATDPADSPKTPQ
jgi:hypothetical protein